MCDLCMKPGLPKWGAGVKGEEEEGGRKGGREKADGRPSIRNHITSARFCSLEERPQG